MAIIKVGAATEVELKEKKHRIEDAVQTTKAAVEEGVVPGGGVALLRAQAKVLDARRRRSRVTRPTGARMVARALEEPLKQIAVNAGLEGGVIVEKVRSLKGANGLNAATGEYEDLVKAGVIDAAKVTRSALQNAASIAALFLTTEAVVADKPEQAGGSGDARRRHGRLLSRFSSRPAAPTAGRLRAPRSGASRADLSVLPEKSLAFRPVLSLSARCVPPVGGRGRKGPSRPVSNKPGQVVITTLCGRTRAHRGGTMGYQDKSRRLRTAVVLAALMATASTMAANALDAGSLLAPILAPVTGGSAAVAPFGAPAGGYAGFATGTVLHAGVAGSIGATLDLVSSTAAATSGPVASAVNSELGRVALPVLPAKGSYGQGIGLGVGLGLLPGVSTGLFGNATATAPPSSAPVEQESASSSGAPIVNVTPLRARAQALSSAGGCVLGSNLANGSADAADVSLAGLAGLTGVGIGSRRGRRPPVVQLGVAARVIVPGSAAGRLGLLGETSQLLGPITLLTGTAHQTTVEVKGQWLLRVTADGRTGAVTYGPQGLAGDQALVVVRNAAGAIVAQASASEQKLAGSAGIHLDIPGVGEIVVGEQPRARGRAGAAQASGTGADAAVDLVRIRLLGQDVRIGHMEAAVAVPAAGVSCPGLEVTITPGTATVAPGGDFAAKVKVRNPNEGHRLRTS